MASRLNAVANRVRGHVLVNGVARVVLFLTAATALQFAFDYGARGVRWSIRAALLGAIITGLIWLIHRRIVRPLRKRLGPAEVANLVERQHPELASSLISAVRFAAGDVGPSASNSPALMTAVVEHAQRQARLVDFGAVVDPKRARRSGMLLAILIAACVSLSLAAPETVGLWFARNVLLQEVEWPKRTHLVIDIEGDEFVGARGDDLVIEATAQGVQPRVVEMFYETASGQSGRETMVTVGSQSAYRYRYTFKNAQEDFDFYLRGGDDQTRIIHARLLERPRVARAEMRIEPPPYTRLDPIQLEDGQRAAQILPGSVVTIWAETNKPVTSATLMAGREVVADTEADAARHRATFSPTETHTYHFALVDDVGLENKRPVRFSLRVVADESPRVRLKLPGAGDMITPEAVLTIEVESTDAYGLATVELIYQVSREGADERTIPLPHFKPGLATLTSSVEWAVAEEAVIPGEMLTLHARASDFDDVNGPNTAQSPEVMLRVVSREELLAELARREQEYRGDFERLVDSQEQLRGDLLSVLGRFQEAGTPETLSADLSPLERRQRNIAGSVNVIRQQFERILAELRVNQLDTLDERERLSERIIGPLTQLAKRDLVAAADGIRQWSREATPEKASEIDPRQVSLLSQMRNVLTSMIQWEGYQEVVNMLRDIIRLQHDLHAETKAALEEQAGDVFED